MSKTVYRRYHTETFRPTAVNAKRCKKLKKKRGALTKALNKGLELYYQSQKLAA
jgi:hypothetical protein